MNKKIPSLLFTSALVLLVAGCASQDTTAPTFEGGISSSQTRYYTNQPFALTVNVQDDVSEEVSLVANITNPKGETTTSTVDNVVLTVDGEHTITVTATDEAGNEATSTTLTISAFDPYAHWSDEQKQLMEDSVGFVAPKSMYFADTTEVYEVVNILEVPLGVNISSTGIDEEYVQDYIDLLVREGYASNDYENAYYSNTITNSTNINTYDKLIDGTNYQRIQSYYYDNDFKLELRKASYVVSNTWDSEFVASVINEAYIPLIPEFAFSADNTNGVMVLTDYNDIMGASAQGSIQGKLFGVSEEEIGAYLDELALMGYTDGSLEDLQTSETTLPMYMDPDTFAMVLIQISSYLEGSTPFYTLDIMCM